ncbi:PT domain-containing protein [Paenibacillus sp. 481]|nr:PT domain-containing protein [Paenibacillus sp. 481]
MPHSIPRPHTYQPTNLPTYQPTNLPTYQPTNLPTYQLCQPLHLSLRIVTN